MLSFGRCLVSVEVIPTQRMLPPCSSGNRSLHQCANENEKCTGSTPCCDPDCTCTAQGPGGFKCACPAPTCDVGTQPCPSFPSCCDSGEVCCDNNCLTGEQCCGSIACAAGEFCIGGTTCCPNPTDTLCRGQCCSGICCDSGCVDGVTSCPVPCGINPEGCTGTDRCCQGTQVTSCCIPG